MKPNPVRLRLGPLAVALLVWSILASPLHSQDPPPADPAAAPAEPLGPPVPAAAIEGLLADLENPARRQELADRLRALLAAARPAPVAPAEESLLETAVGFLQQVGAKASHTVAGVVQQIAGLPARLRDLQATLGDPDSRRRLLVDSGMVALLAGSALAAALAARGLLRRPRQALLRPRPALPADRLAHLGRLGLRWLLGLAAPLAALLTALLLVSVLPLSKAGGAIGLAAVGFGALLGVCWRTVDGLLLPSAPASRPFEVDDGYVGGLANLLNRGAAIAVVGCFALAITQPLAADDELIETLRGIHGLVVLVIAIAVILRLRAWPPAGGADGLGGGEGRGIGDSLRGCGRLWWVVALVYTLGLYALWMGGLEDAFGRALRSTAWTIVHVAIGVGSYMLLAAALRWVAVRLDAVTRTVPVLRSHVPHYVGFVRVAVAVLIALIVVGFVLEAWGVQPLLALQSRILEKALSSGLGILAVLVLAYGLIDVTTAVTDGYLAKKARLGADTAKLRTLVPLVQKATRLIVWALAAVTLMGQVGISIGPVLASIGVLGLAVGFGAQTLVKDVITGVFILIEDVLSVGDMIQIDGISGLVEAISIRTVRLRSLDGTVHTIPYSTVGRIANMTKEFSRYLIECKVAYRENVDEVAAALREVGEQLRADPVFGPDVLDPLEVLGLDRFEDSAVVVRARLRTRPGRHGAVGREFNRRMKLLFEQRGIELPFPHRTIYFGVGKDGTAPPLPLPRPPAAG